MSRLYKLLLVLAVIVIVLPACTSATSTAEVEAPAVEPTEEVEAPAVEPTEETIVDEQIDRLYLKSIKKKNRETCSEKQKTSDNNTKKRNIDKK